MSLWLFGYKTTPSRRKPCDFLIKTKIKCVVLNEPKLNSIYLQHFLDLVRNYEQFLDKIVNFVSLFLLPNTPRILTEKFRVQANFSNVNCATV